MWSNRDAGCGLRVLGGIQTRMKFFNRAISPVWIELDGIAYPFNVDKKSFWTARCGELIGVPIRRFRDNHGLKTADRVWLAVLTPFQRFRADLRP